MRNHRYSDLDSVGKAVQLLRTQANLSQDSVGYLANISTPTISALENNRTRPTLDSLEKISSALQVSLEEVFQLSRRIGQDKIESMRSVVGRNVRTIRESQKITQSVLARRSGMGPSYISNIESGKVGISVDKLQALASALRVDETALVER